MFCLLPAAPLLQESPPSPGQLGDTQPCHSLPSLSALQPAFSENRENASALGMLTAWKGSPTPSSQHKSSVTWITIITGNFKGNYGRLQYACASRNSRESGAAAPSMCLPSGSASAERAGGCPVETRPTALPGEQSSGGQEKLHGVPGSRRM